MDAQLMDLVVRFETRTRQLLMQYKQLQQENAALLQKLENARTRSSRCRLRTKI